ncbi:MAG: PTS sugar transporter subunit IIA [Alphaproteobacteria bacterium]|nr:MAG: PTS sugar transporter subunit IIA [Alphaproteobacteria bacterium]
MIGIIVIAHGRLAYEFVAVLEHVAGPRNNLKALGINPDDNIIAQRVTLEEMITQVDSGRGVVLATDMFGGTPSNLAIAVSKGKNVEVVAGVNLPMLIDLVQRREANLSLNDIVLASRAAGQNYMNVASSFVA